VERPKVSGSYAPLAEYGEIMFSNCEAQLTNNAYGYPSTNCNMTDNNGNVMSQGTLITSTVVQCLHMPTQ
jgi:hypothetical protein